MEADELSLLLVLGKFGVDEDIELELVCEA